ncbi:hypothetical protein [Streptomyces sp. NPDC003327]
MVTWLTVTGAELMAGTLSDVQVLRSRVMVTVVLAGVRLRGGEYVEESLLGVVQRMSPTAAWAGDPVATTVAAASVSALSKPMAEFRFIEEPLP